jgi:hypothetical protein
MMDEGVLDPAAIVRECLAYMSESDVADMAQRIGWLEEEEEDEDEESKD